MWVAAGAPAGDPANLSEQRWWQELGPTPSKREVTEREGAAALPPRTRTEAQGQYQPEPQAWAHHSAFLASIQQELPPGFTWLPMEVNAAG